MITLTMERTKQHVCEIGHCDRPAPETTICYDCVDDVHTALYQFLNVELDRLYDIAIGEEKTADRTSRQHHGKPSAPPDAIKLGTWELHRKITREWPQIIDDLAKRPDAEKMYWKIINGCQQAYLAINGDPKEYAEGDIDDANKKLATPMPMPRLITWLWDNFRIRITRQRIYNWTGRGKISPIVIPGLGYKLYRPKDVLEHL